MNRKAVMLTLLLLAICIPAMFTQSAYAVIFEEFADAEPPTAIAAEQTEAEMTTANALAVSADDTSSGALLLTNKESGTGNALEGAVFGVYDAKTDARAGALTTNADGWAVTELPAGAYYLWQLRTPDGYLPEIKRIAVDVSAGKSALVELTSDIDPDWENSTEVAPPDEPIIVPKTGTAPLPKVSAVVLVCIGLCVFYFMRKLWRRRKNKRKR